MFYYICLRKCCLFQNTYCNANMIRSNEVCTVYSVHCTVYSVQCTVYTVQCTLDSVLCTLYSVQCTVYTVQCTQYTVHCTVYSVQYMYNICIIHCSLYTTRTISGVNQFKPILCGISSIRML